MVVYQIQRVRGKFINAARHICAEAADGEAVGRDGKHTVEKAGLASLCCDGEGRWTCHATSRVLPEPACFRVWPTRWRSLPAPARTIRRGRPDKCRIGLLVGGHSLPCGMQKEINSSCEGVRCGQSTIPHLQGKEGVMPTFCLEPSQNFPVTARGSTPPWNSCKKQHPPAILKYSGSTPGTGSTATGPKRIDDSRCVSSVIL